MGLLVRKTRGAFLDSVDSGPCGITGFLDKGATLTLLRGRQPFQDSSAILPALPCSSLCLPHRQEVLPYCNCCHYLVAPGASRPGWWRRIESPGTHLYLPPQSPGVGAAPASCWARAGLSPEAPSPSPNSPLRHSSYPSPRPRTCPWL